MYEGGGSPTGPPPNGKKEPSPGKSNDNTPSRRKKQKKRGKKKGKLTRQGLLAEKRVPGQKNEFGTYKKLHRKGGGGQRRAHVAFVGRTTNLHLWFFQENRGGRGKKKRPLGPKRKKTIT